MTNPRMRTSPPLLIALAAVSIGGALACAASAAPTASSGGAGGNGGNGGLLVRTGGGNDTVAGGAGTDRLHAGHGDDTVRAGAGDDRIWSGGGTDTVHGGPGNDRIIASSDGTVDTVDCGPGRDVAIVDVTDITTNCETRVEVGPGRTPHINSVANEIRQMQTRTGSDSSEGLLWQVTDGNTLAGAGGMAPGWLIRTSDCWGVTTACDSSGVQTRMTTSIRDIIGSAEVLVDISSLSGIADGGFRQAIIDGAADAERAGRRPLIRMMWGRSPATPFSDGTLRKLQKDVQAAAPHATVVASLMTNTPVTNGYSWNHSKIVAADSKVAMTGGINMWSRSYLQSTNPVTDVAVMVNGPAAADAHRFLDILWKFTCDNEGFGPRYNNTIVPKRGGAGGCPTAKAPAAAPGTGDVRVLAAGRAAYINAGLTTGRNDVREVSAADRRDSGCYIPPLPNPMNGDPTWDGNNPSDTALRALVASAESKVVITQQMLTFACATTPSYDVRLIDNLARKVREGIPVTIVVSNKGGAINTSEQYGADPVADLGVVMKRLTKLMGSKDLARQAACRSLTLAPLRLSTQPTWPGSTAPALHSKVIAVDDAAFMVGSQNAYPNQLQEFAYIVENPTAMADFKRDFLDPVVRYSSAAALPCG